MHLCPFCQGTVNKTLPEFRLSPKRKALYEAIVNSGPDGILIPELMNTFYHDRKYASLRTAIYAIRQEIAPIRIVSKGNRYMIQLLEE